ncbi:MAG: hypothetical protein D6812_04895 [Deltaproteobacteria bacterium]|nr:MAG: hypothetical protein D6812_04895 [Deltaproteobacteria bacterium]
MTKSREKTKMSCFLLITLPLFLGGALCSGSEENTRLSIFGKFSGPVEAGRSSGEVSLSTAILSLREIEFQADSQGPGSGESAFPGPFVIDLLQGEGEVPDGCQTEEPDLSSVTAGEYEAIDFEMHKTTDLPERCVLFDESVHLAGSVMCDGMTLSFTYLDDFNDTFRVESDCPFTIEEDVMSEILVIFDLDAWLAGIDLCTAEREEDGSIVIDRDHNAGMANEIRDNVKASVDAGEDLDGDEDLDAEDCQPMKR